MAVGRLGATDLSAGTETTLFTVTALKTAAFSVNFCNRGTVDALISLALSAAAPAISSEWIEYETRLEPNQVLERTGLVLDAGFVCRVKSSVANVSAVAYGYEDAQ